MIATLAFTLLAPTFSDTPVLEPGALTEACEAAKALDECPSCTCDLTTQSRPIDRAVETSVPIGAVMHVAGDKGGTEYTAAHAVIGTLQKLEHLGRLAETRQEGPTLTVTYEVEGQPQAYQGCPGGCQYEAVGLIHPFIVTTFQTHYDMESPNTTIVEEKRLVLCFESLGGNTCASLPIAMETRETMPGKDPEARRKVLTRAGYERTWKFGKAGDIELGKASGKKKGDLQRSDAHKLSLVDLHSDPDTKSLPR